MLEDLKTKIYNYLTSTNTFNDAIAGRLYYIENIDETIIYPYAVSQIFPGSSDRDSGTRYENINIQFSIFSKASIEVSQIAEKLDSIFDGSEVNIILDNYYTLAIDRIRPPLETRTALGNYQSILQYEIQLEKK